MISMTTSRRGLVDLHTDTNPADKLG